MILYFEILDDNFNFTSNLAVLYIFVVSLYNSYTK
jgi:hypothetical protein